MRAVLIFVLAATAPGFHPSKKGEGQTPATGLLCTLANRRVSESSGIAVSGLKKGVLWTHNDSGDEANFYAFDSVGRDLGVYRLKGVKAVDWEDMAGVTIAGRSWLYFADAGDNAANRPDVVIYRVREPAAVPGFREITSFDTFRLKYPDGAHDCEAVLVAPNGDIQLITKTKSGRSGIYMLRAPKGPGSFTLTKVGELIFDSPNIYNRLATGAAMSRDGKKVVVRTYFSASIWPVKDFTTWFKSTPKPISLPFQIQGEAVCFDESGTRVLSSTEGTPCRVYFSRLL